jgi:hypothetical protein
MCARRRPVAPGADRPVCGRTVSYLRAASRFGRTVRGGEREVSGRRTAESVLSNVKNGLGNVAAHGVGHLEVVIRDRLKRIQYRRDLFPGLLTQTGLTPATAAALDPLINARLPGRRCAPIDRHNDQSPRPVRPARRAVPAVGFGRDPPPRSADSRQWTPGARRVEEPPHQPPAPGPFCPFA